MQTIYIDPPFNKEDGDYHYLVNYKDASWISLLENRINISKDFFIKAIGPEIVFISSFHHTLIWITPVGCRPPLSRPPPGSLLLLYTAYPRRQFLRH